VEGVHRAYLEAGAEIIETNTFSSNAISQADYRLESRCYDLNVASARLARRAADAFAAEHPGRLALVAGAFGPTTRTASIARDVNDPGARQVSFDQIEKAYYDQARGLLDGGADLLLVETITDTVNCKAGLFAIERLFAETGRRVPVMVSLTIVDQSGRMLAG